MSLFWDKNHFIHKKYIALLTAFRVVGQTRDYYAMYGSTGCRDYSLLAILMCYFNIRILRVIGYSQSDLAVSIAEICAFAFYNFSGSVKILNVYHVSEYGMNLTLCSLSSFFCVYKSEKELPKFEDFCRFAFYLQNFKYNII